MATFFGFLVLIAVGLWIAFALQSRKAPSLPFVDIGGDGSFNQEVVGEASYQGELRKIAGRGEVRHECVAALMLEDDNPHDKNAVAIVVDAMTVGYLSRADAKRYRKKKAPADAHGICRALIVGGGKGKQNLGIWLDVNF